MAPIRPMLRAAGVTEQQWRALRVLVDEGPTDTSHLARAALLHAPSLTRILRELVDRGLVERRVDPQDGRRSIIAVSPSGRSLVDRTAVHTMAMLDEYERRFGGDRLAALRRELVDLARAISSLVGDDEAAKRDFG